MTTASNQAERPEAAISQGRVTIVLWVLMLFYALNYVDRQIVGILAEPIAKEFGLSDTQIGVMTGLAFAAFYAGLGIPLARLADNPKTNRVVLLSVCLALWSGMTALCGLAQNYAQMLLGRIGVAVGEAGCMPGAHSLIADMVPPERRSSAIAFFGVGQPVGVLLGMVLGGILADAYGWRTAFLVVGLPGVALALVALKLVPEPRRVLGKAAAAAAPRATVGQAIAEIIRSPAYLFMLGAGSVMAFVTFGQGVWIAIFLQRTHELTPGQTGLWLGLLSGGLGIVGMVVGGWAADRFATRSPRHQLTPVVVSLLIALPLQLLAVTVGDWRLAILLFGLVAGCQAFYFGPGWGLVQGLVSPPARATAAAVKLFVQAVLGLGVGPLLFGAISDILKPSYGDESVRMVLLFASFIFLVPALCYWLASRSLERELAAPGRG
ncbi:MFS transporter [Phenylobacterium sp.]|uniref:spinster family MFS transporter n=1 Tax=Phenylobacterium sp. TaxID=1871053 RepID=UPI002810EF33|nr:MFS transporter [Phenylobacterium sp.]